MDKKDRLIDKTAGEPEKESTLNSVLSNLKDSDSDDELTLRQISDVWRQISIDGQWFKRQIWVILLIFSGIIIYITNRYSAQQEIIEEEQLQNQMQDSRFRALTRSSELTFMTRQSQIEKALHELGDSTLLVSNEAPFQIRSSEDAEEQERTDTTSETKNESRQE